MVRGGGRCGWPSSGSPSCQGERAREHRVVSGSGGCVNASEPAVALYLRGAGEHFAHLLNVEPAGFVELMVVHADLLAPDLVLGHCRHASDHQR